MIECMEEQPLPGPAGVPPAAGWASGPLGEVQAEERAIARHAARRARALAAFAASMPASIDRPPGQPGAMSADRRASRPEMLAQVSEWAAMELSVAVAIPVSTADRELVRGLTLVHRLPGTLLALESGVLHVGHLWPLLDKVAPIADDTVRTGLEADLLAWVAGRAARSQVTTPAQLGAKVRRELLARDVRAAARELAGQLRRRGVHLRPDRAEGMSVLEVLLTVPEAAALLDALGQYADAITDDPADPADPVVPRTRQQKMADCLLDLVLRPTETDRPAVQARLTVVAPVATMLGGDQPAEIGGDPVPAELARALAQGLGLLPGPAVEEETPAPAGPPTVPRDGDRLIGHGFGDGLEDEEWWAAVEARARIVFDDPPGDVQQRLWEESWQEMAGDPAWAHLFHDDDADPVPLRPPAAPGSLTQFATDPAPPAPETAPECVEVAEPSWWAAADAAVDAATTAQLALDRALTRASRAVRSAQIADRADHDAWEQSPAARISRAPDVLTALRHARPAHRAALGDLLERTAGGGLADRPRIALTDAVTGALLALTDARDLRTRGTCGTPACRTGHTVCDHDLTGRPGLGPPAPTAGYRPGIALDRFLRARDRRCRQPGCRRPVTTGELDHNQPYPDGPTAAHAMTGFCTGHHRGKHQAPGWTYDLDPTTGVLTVTTPAGLTAATDPPPY